MLRKSNPGRLALALAGLTMAFTLPTGMAAAVAQASGPVSTVSIATAPNIITTQYSCDLSSYGSSAPVTVNAMLAFAGSVAPGGALGVTLKTPSVSLPSSVVSSLPSVAFFELTATVNAKHASAASVPLSGTNPVSGTLTGLPASKASGSVKFPSSGSGVITVPAPTLTFTPHQSGGTLRAITCTTKAAAQDVSVVVTPATVGTAGPTYKCATTVADATSAILARVPMTVTSSGSAKTGKTATVTLAAGTGAYPKGVASPTFSSDLQVLGAQSTKVALSGAITDLTSPVTRVSGRLSLTKTGTDKILIPQVFKIRFAVKPSGVTIPVPVVIACTINKGPAPVGLTIKVAKGSAQQPTNSGKTGNGGQTQGTGQPLGTGQPAGTSLSQGVSAPAGAPNTGGGFGLGEDLALAAVGLAIVLLGGSLVFIGWRRRRAAS